MFRTILRREFHQGLTSFSFILILAVLSMLVLLSGYTQARYYQSVLDEDQLRRSAHEAENNSQAMVLTKPIPPLLPFFNGIYNHLPNEVSLRAESFFGTSSTEDLKPLDWLFPDIDLGLIIGVLLTLMAIFVSHDTVTGEREEGTLRLILSNSVPRRSILYAKLIGIILLLMLALLYSILLYLGVTLVVLGRGYELSKLRIIELPVFTLFSLLTLIVFAALGVTVSTTMKSSPAALEVSLAIWLVAVVIGPSTGPYIASAIYSVPPPQVARRLMLIKEAELNQAELDEHRKAAAELEAAGAPVEIAWQKYLEIHHAWVERKEEELGRLVDNRKNQIHRQQIIAKYLVVIFPYGAFKNIMGNLCGTGLEDHEAFLNSADYYGRKEFIKASLEFKANEKPWLASSGNRERFQAPPFQVPARSLAQRLNEIVPLMAVLLFEIGFLITISLWKFERYEIC